MKIEIELTNGWWHLKLDNQGGIKYRKLCKLAKALMAYAKGQNL